MPVTTPHLAHPFTLTARGARVVEQDSREEVLQCVWAVLATEPGSRPEEPSFGYPDPLFLAGGVDFDELRAVVGTWEPRADLLTEAEWDGLRERVKVSIP